jgi:hypothetical protein
LHQRTPLSSPTGDELHSSDEWAGQIVGEHQPQQRLSISPALAQMEAWKSIVPAEREFRLQWQSIPPPESETREQLNSTASEGLSELQGSTLINTGPHHSSLEYRYARRPDLKCSHL